VPADRQSLIAKIEALPADQAAEVEDFVEFLASKRRRLAALDRLLAIAPALEAAGAPPVSDQDVASEIEAFRRNRRNSRNRADCS
jgi:hypothetical protein